MDATSKATDFNVASGNVTNSVSGPQPGVEVLHLASEQQGPSSLSSLATAVASFCSPLSTSDPCGPDLDEIGDGEYLNFFAAAEGILPDTYFSAEDGKPFDRSTVDLPSQIRALDPLWRRSRDLRLLVMRARILVLDRDLDGFATTLGAIAEWLEKFWDVIHPKVADSDLSVRSAALSQLELATVLFPLQYMPLFDAGRTGVVTYRSWMIASGEVNPRSGEQKIETSALLAARSETDQARLVIAQSHIRALKLSIDRIRTAFANRGGSAGLQPLASLIDKILNFIDPEAEIEPGPQTRTGSLDGLQPTSTEGGAAAAQVGTGPSTPVGNSPSTKEEAKQALAAIAQYYSCWEPSSPTLPLVRQAHLLIGKSFFEVISILVPTQMDKAAFQLGADQFFELPLSKLSHQPEPTSSNGDQSSGASYDAGYQIQSRAQAIALLEQVQRFFRRAEPSSPIPMLCDRARALAEKDFMSVLKDVLPKAALKAADKDK